MFLFYYFEGKQPTTPSVVYFYICKSNAFDSRLKSNFIDGTVPSIRRQNKPYLFSFDVVIILVACTTIFNMEFNLGQIQTVWENR